MKANMTIRYIGNEDFSRRFLLQRQDGHFYTGRGWTHALDKARLYDKVSTAQRAYHAVQNRKYRGQRKRKFRVQLHLTVRGNGRFSADDLRRFLAQALHLNFDTAAAGNGPNDNCVLAQLALWTLEAVDAKTPCPTTDESE